MGWMRMPWATRRAASLLVVSPLPLPPPPPLPALPLLLLPPRFTARTASSYSFTTVPRSTPACRGPGRAETRVMAAGKQQESMAHAPRPQRHSVGLLRPLLLDPAAITAAHLPAGLVQRQARPAEQVDGQALKHLRGSAAHSWELSLVPACRHMEILEAAATRPATGTPPPHPPPPAPTCRVSTA